MIDQETRPRGVMLTLLQFDGVDEEALVKYNAHRAIDEKEPAIGLKATFGPYAVLERGDQMWAICSEGVGWEVTDEKPLQVDLYPTFEGGFGMVPVMTASFTPAEVRERMTDQTVDLADHVRRFGDRLETNFGIWYRTATGPMP